MPRESLLDIQEVVAKMMAEHNRDAKLIGQLKDHSVKMLRELGRMREEAALQIRKRADEEISAIDRLFDQLEQQEKFRQSLYDEQADLVAGVSTQNQSESERRRTSGKPEAKSGRPELRAVDSTPEAPKAAGAGKDVI